MLGGEQNPRDTGGRGCCRLHWPGGSVGVRVVGAPQPERGSRGEFGREGVGVRVGARAVKGEPGVASWVLRAALVLYLAGLKSSKF